MANSITVKKVFTMVYINFPHIKPPVNTPEKAEEFNVLLELWTAAYQGIPDQRLFDAAARFVCETEKLYPDDNPFAKILRYAKQPSEIEQTTCGDCLALVNKAVSRFGMYRAEEALIWIRGQSELVAAAIERIGFIEYCQSESPEVIRGQLRMVFETEKKRAMELGHVVSSHQICKNGVLQALNGPVAAGSVINDVLHLLEQKRAQ